MTQTNTIQTPTSDSDEYCVNYFASLLDQQSDISSSVINVEVDDVELNRVLLTKVSGFVAYMVERLEEETNFLLSIKSEIDNNITYGNVGLKQLIIDGYKNIDAQAAGELEDEECENIHSVIVQVSDTEDFLDDDFLKEVKENIYDEITVGLGVNTDLKVERSSNHVQKTLIALKKPMEMGDTLDRIQEIIDYKIATEVNRRRIIASRQHATKRVLH